VRVLRPRIPTLSSPAVRVRRGPGDGRSPSRVFAGRAVIVSASSPSTPPPFASTPSHDGFRLASSPGSESFRRWKGSKSTRVDPAARLPAASPCTCASATGTRNRFSARTESPKAKETGLTRRTRRTRRNTGRFSPSSTSTRVAGITALAFAPARGQCFPAASRSTRIHPAPCDVPGSRRREQRAGAPCPRAARLRVPAVRGRPQGPRRPRPMIGTQMIRRCGDRCSLPPPCPPCPPCETILVLGGCGSKRPQPRREMTGACLAVTSMRPAPVREPRAHSVERDIAWYGAPRPCGRAPGHPGARRGGDHLRPRADGMRIPAVLGRLHGRRRPRRIAPRGCALHYVCRKLLRMNPFPPAHP
jgi:hypothetical protein